MKSRYRIAALLLLTGMLLACLPVLFSAQQARKQAIRERFAQLDDTAAHLERQVRDTASLLRQLRQQMHARSDDPCSAEGVALMQRFVMSSQIVKSAMFLDGTRVLCSSNSAVTNNLLLGPPPVVQPDGTLIHSQVRIRGVAQRQYVLLVKDGYGLLAYPDGLIAPFSRPNVSMGLFSTHTGAWLARYGHLQEAWAAANGPAAVQAHYLDMDSGYMVVRRVVPPGTTGTVVASPLASIDTRVSQFAHWFLPAGVLAGLVVLGAAWLISRRQLSARAELLHAINKGHLFLLYQPVFDLVDDTCVGAEALLRWQHEDGKVVTPDLFIPFAEDAGLIHLVSRRVLELVVKDLSGFLRQHPGFHISVNLSPQDLQSPRTPRLLADMQAAIGPGCGRFVVEATERGLLERTSALEVLLAIRGLGIELAVDDFGTGYSSLSYLTTYPFDILKIDKSFTHTACTESVTSSVADHIIDLARSLGMRTLVEGIETREQATFFRQRGVRYGQGYLFSKPLGAAELFAFVPAHSRPDQHARPAPVGPLPRRRPTPD